jgi:acyl-CoA synthetase (AMP-forming)/AMP-acid ligase II
MAEILCDWAANTPDELAFCFLLDGEDEGPRLTYAALDQTARAIAAVLRDAAEPGDRALLLYEPGIDFVPAFFGCLYAGLIPVPAAPPRLDRLAQSWEALASIAADCRPRLLLTTDDLATGLARTYENLVPGSRVHWIVTDRIDCSHAQRWREPRTDPNAVAFLQYTSGATATPKGVMISHRNLLYTEHLIETAAEHQGPGLGVCWLPLYHDFGLIAGVLQAVYHGAAAVLMSPLAMLQRPARWLRAVTRYWADTSGGPNFGYDWCVHRIEDEEKERLDLSRWSVAGIGSEPVSAGTLDRFCEAFGPHGFRREAFYPCYGLAEATLFVTGGAKNEVPVVRTFDTGALEEGRAEQAAADAADARTLVGCGRPWLDQRVVIVDPATEQRCPENTVGEIWAAGPTIALGYWGRAEETKRAFQAQLRDTGEGPYLRTGDLGFVQDGELFVTGRLKDLIIIRGRNHYPQEIEATVQAVHPALRAGGGAAFETGPDGEARLVIVQELARRGGSVDLDRLAGDIRQVVAERHGVQVHDVQFLVPGAVPKTSSGKVQRHACRAGYERGTLRRWQIASS